MSVTGYWILGAVPSAAVERLRADLPAQSDDPEDLSWWQAMDNAALAEPQARGYGSHCPTDEALRFSEMLDARRTDFDADACFDVLADRADEDRFVAAIRKGDPVATLYYGLGFEAAYALPGRAGCFLLTGDEVPVVAPTVETILTMDPHRRSDVLTRMRAWLEVVGDASDDFDVEALIDEPLRILRHAKEHGLGALGIMQWY